MGHGVTENMGPLTLRLPRSTGTHIAPLTIARAVRPLNFSSIKKYEATFSDIVKVEESSRNHSIIVIIASEEKRVACCDDMQQDAGGMCVHGTLMTGSNANFLARGALRTSHGEPLVVLGWLVQR